MYATRFLTSVPSRGRVACVVRWLRLIALQYELACADKAIAVCERDGIYRTDYVAYMRDRAARLRIECAVLRRSA